MLKRCLILTVAAAAVAGASASNVVLSGTATDCFQGGRVNVPSVLVSAFDGVGNEGMVALLRTMDTATFADTDPEAMARFEANYTQLMGMVDTAVALARDTTTSAGAFSLDIAPADSILVFGHAELDDEPFYYGYKVVSGQTNVTFDLDMSLGGCAYVNALDSQ